MTVYVDPIEKWGTSSTWRYPASCHMFTDGPVEELHALAEKIKLLSPRTAKERSMQSGKKLASWFQQKTLQPLHHHYDLTAKKREQAIHAGAQEISHKDSAALLREILTGKDYLYAKGFLVLPKDTTWEVTCPGGEKLLLTSALLLQFSYEVRCAIQQQEDDQ